MEIRGINLEVRTGDTTCQLPKQRLHHFLKLCRFNHVQNLLQLTKEHHLTRKLHKCMHHYQHIKQIYTSLLTSRGDASVHVRRTNHQAM